MSGGRRSSAKIDVGTEGVMGLSVIPEGWTCTRDVEKNAKENRSRIDRIIRAESLRYRALPGVELEDLHQEGRVLALYAISRWERERGRNLQTWIGLVVRNGLHLIVNYERATKRMPRVSTTGKRKDAPIVTEFVEPDELETPEIPDPVEMRQQLELVERVLFDLPVLDQQIVRAKMHPPPELEIAARNVSKSPGTITNGIVARYFGVSPYRVRRALTHAHEVWSLANAGA